MKSFNITSTFIDLRSDYGFKRLFGDKKRVGIMKRFLNALFEGEMVITDVEYHDKEILPPSAKEKRIIYDIYCTTDTGHHFVVEMQQEYSDIFGKRVLFYVSAALYRQGEQGKNYDSYQPVVAIVVTDFNMIEFENKLVNDIVLMERTSHRILSEDMRIMFVSLASVPKDWKECDTELKRILYLIKNMIRMDKKSEAYRSGEYQEIFDASEVASMAQEEMVAYSASVYRMKEMEDAVRYAEREFFNRGLEEGEARGIAKGETRGIAKGIAKTALNLRKANVPLEIISASTGLSIREIQDL